MVQAKLTASDDAAGDSFGESVALSGDTALAGAPNDSDAGLWSGSAYIFVRSGTSWIQQARAIEFGTGCAGTIAVPVLQPTVGPLPKIGATFNVVLSSLPVNNAAFLILGLSNTQWFPLSLPMSLAPFGAPDCSLLVSGDFSTVVNNTTGTAIQGFRIPLDPGLVGLHIYFQGYVQDPGANAFGVAVSNGLEITIRSL